MNPRRLFTLHDFQSCSLDHYETPPYSGHDGISRPAERVGFEPTRACTLPLFESGTFDHSDISPLGSIAYPPGHDNMLFFAKFALFIEPARELYVRVIFHTLAHFAIIVEVFAHMH